MKKQLLFLWNILANFRIFLKEKLLLLKDFFYRKNKKAPRVMSIDETLDYIIENQCSVSRFGDGEIKLASGVDISFQKSDERLSEMLKKILKVKCDGFLPCIVDCFESKDELIESANTHWKKHMSLYRKNWYDYTSPDITYGNAFISRFYMQYKDKSEAHRLFEKLKKLWDSRDIIIVEGEKSRLGIGNNLFDNTKSIRRILIPVDNAFNKYDDILDKSKQFADRDTLFILAAGPAATVLAYDLFKCGYHALDIGHADIEYEWFLAGATKKQPVKNKYVNEAGKDNGVGEIADKDYLSQIICKI